MPRALGVLYLSGALLVALSLLLPHPDEATHLGLYGVIAAGAVSGGAMIVFASRVRPWMMHPILAGGTALVCLCVYFAGVAAGFYSYMFVWVIVMAASFLSWRGVAAHYALIACSWGLTLGLVEESTGFSATTRWLLTSFVLAVTAIVMTRIVEGRRATEDLLRATIDEAAGLREELEHQALHDPLTGVANRRRFEQELPREMSRVRRSGAQLCVIAFDVDDFKQFNDANGHGAGDLLLTTLSSGWSDVLRAGDLLARLGGDEFAALLPDCDLKEGHLVVRRLRESVPAGRTCSIGIACWDAQESPADLMARADEAMYRSKSGSGRFRRDNPVPHHAAT